MSENHLAKKEYFDLVRYLNSANKLKNEDSHLFFEIVVGKNNLKTCFACLTTGPKVILACQRVPGGKWTIPEITRFIELEKFTVMTLNSFIKNKLCSSTELTKMLVSLLFHK